MFYRNTLKTLSTKEKEIEYSLFDKNPIDTSDDRQDITSGISTYNFITESGALKTGYGFEELKMPTSRTELDNETDIVFRGEEIYSIWSMKWYDSQNDRNNYYLFYYNDEGYICYDNLFNIRYASYVVLNDFTEVPYALYYRIDGEDLLLFFGEGENLLVVSDGEENTISSAPIIKSCCSHYGKLFAITASPDSQLVYSEDVDVTSWTDEKTKNLDFTDERGCLNKIISFNDYVYVFRDYGITQLSIYGSDEEFSISHLYLSDSYIYPNTITQSGDNVYFLERNSLKYFNGSSVRELKLDCKNLLSKTQPSPQATCFEGKIYLACRCNYGDDETVGCESYSGGYINNTLLVYDIENERVEILRGVDINKLLPLNNPLKSKLIACFNNEHIGKIGEITHDGKIFGNAIPALWQSVKTDLGYHGKKKRIKYFTIKTEAEAVVTLSSEKMTKQFQINGKDYIQKIPTFVLGNEFSVKITSSGNANISNFVMVASVKE